jgi:DNA anti-recombination protein RmuC
MGMADALTEANYTLGDQLNNSAESIKEMIAAYDGSIDAENRIAESLRSRYEMELAFIEQIRSASESITQLIAGAREDVFLTGLTDEEKYNYFRGEAESAAAQALMSDSPEEIQRWTERAIDYERRAFGLLDEGQQDEMRDGFLSFIDELGEGTTARLAELEQAAAEQSQELLNSLGTMLNANAEAARQSNEQFATSVETFAAATVRLDQAVARLQQIQVVVDVRREDAYETQGGY